MSLLIKNGRIITGQIGAGGRDDQQDQHQLDNRGQDAPSMALPA